MYKRYYRFMMALLFLAFILAMAFPLISIAHASDYKVGTGGANGNYYSMMTDVASPNYCGSALGDGNTLSVEASDGSMANLSGMMNKKYSIALVQADVLMSQAKKDPRRVNINRMKIITGLHIETVHLLVPVGYTPKQKDHGLFSKFKSMFGSDDNPVNISLDMLKDQQIASWGGSVTSAAALSYFFNLNWTIVTIPPDRRSSVTDMPILLVGGQPYKPVADLLATGKYKIIGLDYKEIASKASFYVATQAIYSINGKAVSVPSIGIQALLIGKAFRNEDRNIPMQNLAKCIDENLADLADDPDTNPNWNSVYELHQKDELLNWSYFEIK